MMQNPLVLMRSSLEQGLSWMAPLWAARFLAVAHRDKDNDMNDGAPYVVWAAALGLLIGGSTPGAAEVQRYLYYPVSFHPSVMVAGCDGYGLGTIRVDRLRDEAATCFPLRLGCNDTRDAGCEYGKFATSSREIFPELDRAYGQQGGPY